VRIAFFFRSGIYVMSQPDRRIDKVDESYYSDATGPCTIGRRFDWSPDGRMLAYWVDDPGTPRVFVWDGRDSRPVARGYGPDWQTAEKLGFTTATQLACAVKVIELIGSSESLWRDNTRGADWSPGGRYVVYTDTPSRSASLNAEAIIATGDDAAELRRLAPGALFAWSPDGSHFAYVRRPEVVSSASGVATPVGGAPGPDVPWTLVVGQPERKPETEIVTGIDLEFAWSPGGKQIAYSVRQVSEGQREIHIVSIDDPSNRRYLTIGSTPAWSPDGGTIVFNR
jgi:Tol biopolymer transport system component